VKRNEPFPVARATPPWIALALVMAAPFARAAPDPPGPTPDDASAPLIGVLACDELLRARLACAQKTPTPAELLEATAPLRAWRDAHPDLGPQQELVCRQALDAWRGAGGCSQVAGGGPPAIPDPAARLERELWDLDDEVGVGRISQDGKRLAFLDGDPHGELQDERSLDLIEVASGRVSKRLHLPSSVKEPDVAARLRALDAMRRALNGTSWLKLAGLEVLPDPTVDPREHGLGHAAPMLAVGQGLTVMFHEPRLIVIERQSGRRVLERAYPDWSIEEEDCSYFTVLSSAAVHLERRLLVVTVRGSGSPHHCWGRSARHVVRLPAR